MTDYNKWLDRIQNLLDVQKEQSLETITATFNRRELIELKIMIEVVAEQTTACLNPEKLNEVKQDFKQDLNKDDDEMFGDYMSPIV